MSLFDSKKRFVPGVNSFGKPKTPPGQIATEKFPVLTEGETPDIATANWSLRVWGAVEQEIVWNWEEFMKLPQTTIEADFHCVTKWSRFDDRWTGVLFRDILPIVKPAPAAMYVMQHAYGGYTTDSPIRHLADEDAMLAHTFNGEPLPRKHGGPVRVFTPRRYAWKGAKWVNGLEFMTKWRPGFWELNGYNTPADPWKEERFG